MSDKFDVPLRMKLRELEGTERADDPLSVFIEAVDAPSAEQQAELEAAGLEVGTVAGRIVTARGAPTAIRRAASFEYVASIALSQTRLPVR